MDYSVAKTVISFTVLLTAASCSEVICPSILESEADIEHLQSNMENRNYRLGEVVDYHCDAGYRILGKTWRECSGPSLDFPNQTWSDLDPICSEVECPDPGDIQFEAGRYLESTNVGGSVRFSCRSGYSLRGSAVRFCQPDGMWNGTLTTCDHESFFCPNPGIPIGGRMVNAHKMRFREGEIVSYECKGDKVLIGSRQRECLKTRAWSGEPPTCQGPYDFEDTLKIASRFGREIEGIVADLQAPIIDQSPKDRRRRFIDPGYTQGMDIYFVFDASGSIPKAHFRYSLDLAKALVSKVGGADGPRRARYGACVFADRAQISFLVSDPQPSVEIVLLLIDGLIDQVNPEEIGQGTATGKALQLVHETMIPAAHDRPNAKKYLFLFTDGKPNVGGYIATARNEAATLRSRYGVQIHCIGIGAEVDRNELQEIASRPISEHLFFIRDYGEVGLLAQSITQQELDYSPCGYSTRPSDRRSPRIVGGEFSESGNWPWQVALFCDPNIAGCDDCVPRFFCGGSLIAPNWVLSAAQCFRGCEVANIRVYTGIIDISEVSLGKFDPALVYSLDGDDALIMHEAFNWYLDNDIALVRLSRNVKFSPNVRPICLPQPTMQDTELYSTNGAAYVAGWGSTDPYDTDGDCLDDTNQPTSSVLKELAIPVRTDRECRDSIQDHFRCSVVTAYKPAIAFCAGYSEGNLDACRGDSGGPVMRQLRVADGSRRWVQIGIVSWGEGCAQEGRYGIYTRLSAYKEWIHDHIGAGESPIQIHEHTSDHECPRIKIAELDPNLSLAADGGNSPGSMVEFVCRSGFHPLGETTLTCQAGSWSHPFPTCKDYSPCGYNTRPSDRRSPRIVGGEFSESGDWPWQVALFCDPNIAGCDDCVPTFFCGGSLIARKWVLSAAQCFRRCDVGDIRVYTGIIDKSQDSLLEFDPTKMYNLDGDDALIMHEAFNRHLDNDIALLRLSRNVTFSPTVRPICLPQPTMQYTELYSTNGAAYVAGWGSTDPYDIEGDCLDDPYQPASPVLKEVAIPVRTDQECRDSIQDHFRCSIVTAYKPAIAFCAGYSEGNLDACKGDSGGPVMRQLRVADGSRRWVQIGIVSWGEGCAQEGRYGIYTRLSAYKEWIHDHIGAGESPIQIHEHTNAGVDAPESPECNCEVWQECMDTKRDGEWTCRCIHPQHCDDVVGQEQCGSDGRTYASICKLKATACLLDLDIRVASQGPCPESPGFKNYSVYESPDSSIDPDFLTTGGLNNESVPTRTASDQVTFDDCGYQENPRHRTWATVAGGQHSEAGQWPWQVALFCHVNCTRCLPRFFCGGSLIARNWVLSAAHCFRQCKPSDIRVYTGIIDKSMSSLQYFDPALVYTLDSDHALIRHEAFNSDNLDNDIALLRLSCNVKLSSRVRTICMPHLALTGRTLYLPSGEPSMLAGWGTAQPYDYGNLCIDGIKPTSSLLRHVVVPVRTHAECRQSFLHHFQCATVSDYKPDIAFCAGVPEGGSDACKGDSGGPVMRQLTVADGTRRWVQIGIVSWGEGCAVEGRYGIYTRLSTYTDWIEEHVGA